MFSVSRAAPVPVWNYVGETVSPNTSHGYTELSVARCAQRVISLSCNIPNPEEEERLLVITIFCWLISGVLGITEFIISIWVHGS